MKINKLVLAIALATPFSAMAASQTYSDFPVTVKDYKGDKKTSTAYTGQIARHLLHNSLKKLAGKGDGKANPELKAQMMSYYAGKDAGRAILSPKSKDGFAVLQSNVDELSKGKDLKGKTYKGAISGWPGNMTGPEVLEFMINKASSANQGYDRVNGYDYAQLISKFAMGAVFYNQAVDNYLDEKLEADNKPNNKPYSDGAAYTGKEHVWDEAFGYFGAPAHALALDAKTVYGIAKGKKDVFAAADANKDGKIDLYTEMTYAHAYYAADADKAGTNYLNTITKAFIDGRQLIADAKGEALTDAQRTQLKQYAATIKTNWEKVIAEAAFKYAGSVYKDLQKIEKAISEDGSKEGGADVTKDFRAYVKHWGELKGFVLALQAGGKDLGEVSVKLNRMIGFSPVLLGNTQVIGIDKDGNYVQEPSESLGEYMLHMLKVQKLLADTYGLKARKNDQMGNLGSLADKLGNSDSAEND